MPLPVLMTWGEMAARLAVALLIGAAIGLERESSEKAAGVRTYMLISLGIALLIFVSTQTGAEQQDAEVLSRIIPGIMTGIGFIGAGVIVHHSSSRSGEPLVEGETSAAAIWMTAALVIAASCGLWKLALVGAGLTLLILRGVKQLEY